jgi:branched-chain amino acid aminotransferase
MTVPTTAPRSTSAREAHGRGVVSLNGTLVPGEAAVVSVFDHGLLYGDGVFDTMFASYGMIFRLADHLARFRRSLRAIRLTLPIAEQRLESEILRTVAANGLRDG